jgi:hypothetical protein
MVARVFRLTRPRLKPILKWRAKSWAAASVTMGTGLGSSVGCAGVGLSHSRTNVFKDFSL